MNIIFLLLVLAKVSAKTKVSPNAVNLALETSLIFDGENTKKDISLIDNLQNFLKKLKGYLKQREQTSFRSEDTKEGIFTTFFKDLSRIIINYDNESLKNLTDILALVMEPYYYKGSTFHKIIEDENLKSYIKDKVIDWSDTDPKLLKYKMAIAAMSKEGTPLTLFGNYLNNFFSQKDSKRLKKMLKRFNKHGNATDMHKLVKKTLEFVIFHRYNKLDQTAKHDLSIAIKNITAFLTTMHATPQLRSPKNDYPNDDHNRTGDVNIRRYQAKVNSLLPKKVVLHKNVEFHVKTPNKEEKKDTGIVTDEDDKLNTKPIKGQKWQKLPYISMEVKLDDDKHIAIETNDHVVDTVIIDDKHSSKKGKKKKDSVKQTTLIGINETVAEKITTTEDVFISESTTESNGNKQVDLYKQIMAINIGGEKEEENTDVEHKGEIKNESNDTRQPKTMALIQNSKKEANITKEIDTNAQKKVLNQTASTKDKSKGTERRMGVYVQRVFPEDVADVDLDTDELKMKVDKNPHTSATVGYTVDSKEKEENETKNKRDDAIDSDREEYQNKITDGANKIRDLLDNAIAMKLLGIA